MWKNKQKHKYIYVYENIENRYEKRPNCCYMNQIWNFRIMMQQKSSKKILSCFWSSNFNAFFSFDFLSSWEQTETHWAPRYSSCKTEIEYESAKWNNIFFEVSFWFLHCLFTTTASKSSVKSMLQRLPTQDSH